MHNTNFIKLYKRKGFTLIELLLYVSTISVIIFSISAFISQLIQIRVKNQTIAEVEQQGVQVLQQITQTARNSTSITSPSTGTSATSLTLVVPSGANSPTVFDLSAGAIRVKEGAGAIIPLTSSQVTASGLTFTNLSAAGTFGNVRISFTLTYVNNSGRNEYNFAKTFTSSATLRF